MHTLMKVCIMSAYVCLKCALSLHQVCIFITQGFSPEKKPGDMQTWCRKRAHYTHFLHTRCILSARVVLKVCIWRTLHTWPECASLQKSGMHTLHTFPLVCKVCTMFQTLSGKSSKTPSNPTPMHTQGIFPPRAFFALWSALPMGYTLPL